LAREAITDPVKLALFYYLADDLDRCISICE
jgi:hypothetical protein